MVGGGAKLEIAQSAAAAFEQHDHLSIFDHVAEVFACFGVISHSAGRHISIAVLTILARAATFRAVAAMTGKDVAVVAQVEERPVVVVAAQVDVSTTSPIAAVRATEGLVFAAVHVHRATSALAGTTINLYVVDEIGFHFF